MNILFLVPYVPNLIRVRPYNLIRGLAARGHRVTVLAPWRTERDLQDIAILKTICHRVETVHLPTRQIAVNGFGALLTGQPLQAWHSWSPALLSLVNDCGPIDLIHVEHLRGAKYAQALRESGLPVVWDSVDCITHLFRQASAGSRSRMGQWMTRFELGRTGRYEGDLVKRFEQITVTSEKDRQALAELGGLAPEQAEHIHVLSNGVDLDYFKPDDSLPRQPNALVVSGKMSYHANVTMTLELAERIMPLIWAERPETTLYVVGKDPTRELLALGNHPRIVVTGEVPDIRPYLRQAAVAVAPVMYGAGIQNKVLEAMACATPVVTTPGAAQSIAAVDGQDYLIGQTAESFAAGVLHLLADPNFAGAIGRHGRQFIETYHAWPEIVCQLENIYDATVIKPKR